MGNRVNGLFLLCPTIIADIKKRNIPFNRLFNLSLISCNLITAIWKKQKRCNAMLKLRLYSVFI